MWRRFQIKVQSRHLARTVRTPAFGEGVRAWRLDGCLEDPDALVGEDLVEAGDELGVPVADQERVRRAVAVGELVGQVAGLLGDLGGGRVFGDAGEPDVAAVESDEEQDVEPGQRDGVDGEEVAGRHAAGLGA